MFSCLLRASHTSSQHPERQAPHPLFTGRKRHLSVAVQWVPNGCPELQSRLPRAQPHGPPLLTYPAPLYARNKRAHGLHAEKENMKERKIEESPHPHPDPSQRWSTSPPGGKRPAGPPCLQALEQPPSRILWEQGTHEVFQSTLERRGCPGNWQERAGEKV